MKRIGIVTLNGNNNYGNKLQNFALIYILKKFNFDINTLWKYDSKKYILKTIIPLKRFKRYSSFQRFTNRYLNVKYFMDLEKIKNKYDYYVVGSDQVWNYNFKTFSEDFFLPFSNREKNISYAASIGVDNVKSEFHEIFKNGLQNFKNISVREDSAKRIVEQYTNRDDIEVVLDPTMLLTDKDWENILKKPKGIGDKKYILNYFLGNLSDERKKVIEKFAQENDFYVINLLDKNDPYYSCGPSEFLFLEKNAALICTDSFHSSVFAILFNRPFLVFDREQQGVEDMSSRIETLLSKFEIKDRKFNCNIEKKDLQHDYTRTYEILNEERKKSMNYLKKSLNI